MEDFMTIVGVLCLGASAALALVGVYHGANGQFDKAAYYMAFAVLLEV